MTQRHRTTKGSNVTQGNKEVSQPGNSAIEASTTTPSPLAAGTTHDSYRALHSRDFRLLIIGVFLSMFGRQMITVAIGWELYERTSSALVLGGVGLAQVLPLIALFLPSGYAADRYNRKYVVMVSQVVLGLASLVLALLSYQQGALWLIYGCLVVMGSAQSFSQPASSALVAQVVPEQAFENATTWRSSVAQLSAVIGPATGGFLIGIFHGATIVYVLSAVAALIFALLLLGMRSVRRPINRKRRKGSKRPSVRWWKVFVFWAKHRSCWQRLRWIFLRSCLEVQPRCCPSLPETFCTSARLAWDGCKLPIR
jgi:MFS family permease